MEKLGSIFEIPGYTFFRWGFTLPKRTYPDIIGFFGLSDQKRSVPVRLVINAKEFNAKIDLVKTKYRIGTLSGFPTRGNRIP